MAQKGVYKREMTLCPPPPQIKQENGYENIQRSVRSRATVSRADISAVRSDTTAPGVDSWQILWVLTGRAILVVKYFDSHSWVWDNTFKHGVSRKKELGSGQRSGLYSSYWCIYFCTMKLQDKTNMTDPCLVGKWSNAFLLHRKINLNVEKIHHKEKILSAHMSKCLSPFKKVTFKK